jgi:hypothetical protein
MRGSCEINVRLSPLLGVNLKSLVLGLLVIAAALSEPKIAIFARAIDPMRDSENIGAPADQHAFRLRVNGLGSPRASTDRINCLHGDNVRNSLSC